MPFKPEILLGKHCNLAELFEASDNKFDFKSVVSLGDPSNTEPSILRINTPNAVKNSHNRFKTKLMLAPEPGLNTTKFMELKSVYDAARGARSLHLDKLVDHVGLPMVAKARNVYNRNHKFLPSTDSIVEFVQELPDTGIDSYILESYFKHTDEYRVFVSPLIEGHSIKYIFPKVGKDLGLVYDDEDTRKDGIILSIRLLAEKSAKRINQRRPSSEFRYEKVDLPKELLGIAMQAIKACKLDVGFVDFLYNDVTDAHRISRVGCNPGISLDKTGRNLVGEYLDRALRDIIMHKHLSRNRLSQVPKYGGPDR